jgi:hypothetical protein
MKYILMAIMAVAVAVTFSAPSFAAEEKKDKKDEKKGGHALVYVAKKDEKKDVKEPAPKADTFSEAKQGQEGRERRASAT